MNFEAATPAMWRIKDTCEARTGDRMGRTLALTRGFRRRRAVRRPGPLGTKRTCRKRP